MRERDFVCTQTWDGYRSKYENYKKKNKQNMSLLWEKIFLEYLIKTYSNELDIVLDNCAGSGSVGIACLNTNRRFILIEKDKEIFEKAKQRISNHEKFCTH